MGPMNKVLVLHGWTYTTDKWQPLLSFLQEKGIPAEMLNVPGLTDSTNRAWTLDDYVEWLKGKVDAEGQVILMGHSNGGRISLAFTAKYPEKVSQLILIDSAGIYPKGLAITLKRNVFKAIAQAGKKITSSPALRALLYKAAREGDYKNATPEMRQTMANLLSVDLTPILESISVPTLIIWGEQDKATPLADGKLMHARIPHSAFYPIASAKHSPQITHWQEVGKRIAEELEGA
jgi:pimeloyl-ACP methyl ester carboxylesterase